MDIYDENGCRTGKIIERGTELNKGEFIYAVHVYIYNLQGQWLIQKRSENLKNFPGQWEFTSGCIIFGEDSLSGAIRETTEELGTNFKPEELCYKGTFRRKKNFVDIYFGITDYKIENFTIDEKEVADIKYITREEMISLVEQLPNREPEYKELVIKAISEME